MDAVNPVKTNQHWTENTRQTNVSTSFCKQKQTDKHGIVLQRSLKQSYKFSGNNQSSKLFDVKYGIVQLSKIILHSYSGKPDQETSPT